MVPSETLYALPWTVSSADDCDFYHWMEIPGHGLVAGAWDLRGGEDAYLGHTAMTGRRVLELGPASGYLTFHMESRGAEVVAVELPPGADWDMVPQAGVDLERYRVEHNAVMQRVRRGFWFAHSRFNSVARVHYSPAYALAADLGHFDVALMGSICLHLRDPLRAVESVARLSDRMIITDRHWPELVGQPVARLSPSAASGQWDTWWEFSPDLLTQFLGVLGFGHTEVSFHEQRFTHPDSSALIPMFTVVASRLAADADSGTY